MMYTATEKERKTSGKNTKFESMCENLVNFEKKIHWEHIYLQDFKSLLLRHMMF